MPGARGRGAGLRAESGWAPELCVPGRQAPTRHWAIRQPDRGPLGQTAPRDTPQLPMSRCLPKPETTPASEPQPHLRRPQGLGTDPARGAGARATRFPPEKRRPVPPRPPPLAWPLGRGSPGAARRPAAWTLPRDFRKRKLADPAPNRLPLILRYQNNSFPGIVQAPARGRPGSSIRAHFPGRNWEARATVLRAARQRAITAPPCRSGGRTRLRRDELSRRATGGRWGAPAARGSTQPELVKHGCDSHGPLRACCRHAAVTGGVSHVPTHARRENPASARGSLRPAVPGAPRHRSTLGPTGRARHAHTRRRRLLPPLEEDRATAALRPPCRARRKVPAPSPHLLAATVRRGGRGHC